MICVHVTDEDHLELGVQLSHPLRTVPPPHLAKRPLAAVQQNRAGLAGAQVRYTEHRGRYVPVLGGKSTTGAESGDRDVGPDGRRGTRRVRIPGCCTVANGRYSPQPCGLDLAGLLGDANPTPGVRVLLSRRWLILVVVG